MKSDARSSRRSKAALSDADALRARAFRIFRPRSRQRAGAKITPLDECPQSVVADRTGTGHTDGDLVGFRIGLTIDQARRFAGAFRIQPK